MSHPIKLIITVPLFVVLLNFVFSVDGFARSYCCEDYCYDSDAVRTQINYFSTKTSYFIGKREQPGKYFDVPNCTPTKIWFNVRHGARLPKGREIKRFKQLEKLRNKIIKNYEKGDSKPVFGPMCDGDLKLLKNWKWDRNITKEYEEFLTAQGWDEVKSIAIRFKNIFPDLFPTPYNKSQYLFRYTNADRSESTFEAYVDGLFGAKTHETIQGDVPPGRENDALIMPYFECRTDKEETRGNRSEYYKYMKSTIMSRLVSDVSERLGFSEPLQQELVLDMYEMCIYDQAWNVTETKDYVSPWCAAFTPGQIYHLEYPEDLRKYYESGYGREGNNRLLCSLMNDMIKHLSGEDDRNTAVYLTHSSSFLLLLSSIGAFKDYKPLLANNYYSMSNRNWRLSNIAPLGSNLAVVKYSCPNEIEKEKVKFFLNEEPIDFDWCEMGLCNWTDVKEQYKVYTEVNCTEYFCVKTSGLSGSITMQISTFLVILLPAILAIIYKF